MKTVLLEWAKRLGYQVAWGPARVLLEGARGELERRVRNAEIDPVFARENLSFGYDCGGREDGTLLMVVMPRPAHLVGFVNDGTRMDLLVPPTYEHYRSTFERVRRDLTETVLTGFRVATLDGPLKLLAARLGLVRYGRNNLAYAPGFGSYLQLLGYATDAPLPVPPAWTPSEPALLDECESCGACAALCPTEAIAEGRVLLKAERCLTLANETAGPWPAHVPRSAHHCLIGCLLCQRNCPANPPLSVAETGVVFGEEETRALLLEDGPHEGHAWDRVRGHLETLGQSYEEPVIGRNLRAFLLAGYD